jgi:hypothetical protein
MPAVVPQKIVLGNLLGVPDPDSKNPMQCMLSCLPAPPQWKNLNGGEKAATVIVPIVLLALFAVWLAGLIVMGKVNHRSGFLVLTACLMFIPGLQPFAVALAIAGLVKPNVQLL